MDSFGWDDVAAFLALSVALVALVATRGLYGPLDVSAAVLGLPL